MNAYKVHYVAYLDGIEWGDNIFVRAKTESAAIQKARREIATYCELFDDLEAVKVMPEDLPVLQKYFAAARSV